MDALNIVEIEETIKNKIAVIRSPQELLELQKWAKKAKKQKVILPSVTSFKKFYYTWDSSIYSNGSGKRIGSKVNKVSYTSFVYMGIEIKLTEDDAIKCIFNEQDFSSHRIWIDSRIKYGGTECFPKKEFTEMFGLDFKGLFVDFLATKGYYVLSVAKRKVRCFYLCNNERNAIKLLTSRRLNKFDLCNNQVVKIEQSQLDALPAFLGIKDWDTFTRQQKDQLKLTRFLFNNKKKLKMVYERKPNIPTIEQVREVFMRNGGNDTMAEAFYNKYDALGWFLGNSPIINFVGIANNFIRNWKENEGNKRSNKRDGGAGRTIEFDQA